MIRSIEMDEKNKKLLDDSGCAEDATTTGAVTRTMIPNEMKDWSDGSDAVPTARSTILIYGGTGRVYAKASRDGSRRAVPPTTFTDKRSGRTENDFECF